MSDAAIEQFAEGLWCRLRDILLTQSRWDAFVHDPEGENVRSLATPDAAEQLASDMILRALRAAVDPVNHAILRRLVREPEVDLSALIDLSGLSRAALIETLNDLAQVGLASYAAGTGRVGATSGAIGFLAVFDEFRRCVTQRIEESGIQNPESKAGR